MLPENSFPKAARLLKRSQFLALSHPAARPDLTIKAGSFLVVGSLNGLDKCRLGVTVTKRVAPAVGRNRLKRLVREFFRQSAPGWPAKMDLLFIARHRAGQRSRQNLWSELKWIDQKLALWKKNAPAKTSGPGQDASPMAPSISQAESKAANLERERGQAEKDDFRPPPNPRNYGVKTDGDYCNSPASSTGAWSAEAWALALWQLPGRLTLALIFFYQKCISPLLPPSCRFRPTCSSYAAEAVKVHGFWRGSYLAGRRILKCHPFHSGGYDPVPPKK